MQHIQSNIHRNIGGYPQLLHSQNQFPELPYIGFSDTVIPYIETQISELPNLPPNCILNIYGQIIQLQQPTIAGDEQFVTDTELINAIFIGLSCCDIDPIHYSLRLTTGDDSTTYTFYLLTINP